MPKPRCEIVSLDVSPYYHCTSRCVRRAFLCGSEGDRDYEHRRGWIEDRILQLTQIFSMDVCAYAVMSNHYHVVLHVDPERAAAWDLKTLFQHWGRLFCLPPLVEQYLKDETMDPALLAVVKRYATKYRDQLTDISWFMRTLNEPIARRANKEDGCTGHFWESRFSSTLLADEAALLACMVYVDLNPVRANMAAVPEASDYTSIKARIDCPEKTAQLMAFLPLKTDQIPDTPDTRIPFSGSDYLQLVDWTGRAVRENKRGHIHPDIPPILQRLNLDVGEQKNGHPPLEKPRLTLYAEYLKDMTIRRSSCLNPAVKSFRWMYHPTITVRLVAFDVPFSVDLKVTEIMNTAVAGLKIAFFSLPRSFPLMFVLTR